MGWSMFADIWKYNTAVIKYLSEERSGKLGSMFYEPISIKLSGGYGTLKFERDLPDESDEIVKNYILVRSIINDCACAIAMINDKIQDLKPDDMSEEEFKQYIDKRLFVIGDFNGVHLQEFKEKDLVDDEHIKMNIAQKLKNALAHANFEITGGLSFVSNPLYHFELQRDINGGYMAYPDGINLRFDNEHIDGEISLDRLISITESYMGMYNMLYEKKYGNEDCETLSEFMEKRFSRMTDVEKKFLTDYINRYVGNDIWENMDDDSKLVVLQQLSDFKKKNVVNPQLSLYKDYRMSLALYDDWVNDDDINECLKPLFYVNQLLSTGFFVFDYARELNHSNENTMGRIDYLDLNAMGINPIFRNDNDKLFSKRNSNQEALDKRDALRSEYKNRYLKEFANLIKLNAGDRDVPEIDDEVKNNITNGIIKVIGINDPDADLDSYRTLIHKMLSRYKKTDLSDDEKEMKKTILGILSVMEKSTDSVDLMLSDAYPKLYDDCDNNREMKNYSNLARHLRNALAHGYYKIDFSNLTSKTNLNQLNITLYDYDEDANVNEDEANFEVTMTAGKFVKLINSFATHIDQQLTVGNYDDRILRREAKREKMKALDQPKVS